MTKELATKVAIQAMRQTGQRYSIAQVRNGQWMCERTEFVLTHSRFASVESRDNHAQGWATGVESFAKFVEGLS